MDKQKRHTGVCRSGQGEQSMGCPPIVLCGFLFISLRFITT